MTLNPIFPTELHQKAAELINDYFLSIPSVDTVLVVNSCARGQAVLESDLDFAILVKPNVTKKGIEKIEIAWNLYSKEHDTILAYKKVSPFAHLHLDVIDGNYAPTLIENGEPIDYFEIEIGNHICYSAPMSNVGAYFKELKEKWLPYYNEELRLDRLTAIRKACEYDLAHIPIFVKRGLYFQALDILHKAFQEYLQALFIAHKVYPIAYNKWIKEQIVECLKMPTLYPKLPTILSITDIESNEINQKALLLQGLLQDL
jgi:predicted nucleotidyltransferase